MTLVELVQARVFFYKRVGWGEGQYVHLDRLYRTDAAPDSPRGAARLCFCRAPIDGNDPSVEDDLWMKHEGPGAVEGIETNPISANMRALSPLAIMALMSRMGPQPTPAEAVKEQMPDLPDWQINQGEMRA